MTQDDHAGEASSDFERIVEELRELRKRPLHTIDDFDRTPTILWHLGQGNANVAAAFFRHISQDLDDSHVQAAMALILPRTGETLEDRMATIAVDAGKEASRTVRRWADDGFRLIAKLILDWSAEEGNDEANVDVRIQPAGANSVLVQMETTSPPGRARSAPPEIRSSGERLTALEDLPRFDQLAPDEYLLQTIARFEDNDDDRSLFVRWLGNTRAYFSIEILPNVMPGWTVVVTATRARCEVRWERPDDENSQNNR